MTKLRLDKVINASMIETYTNYGTVSTNVRLFGSFPSGTGYTDTFTIPYTRGKTRADLYAYNPVTGVKMPFSSSSRINPFVSVAGEFYNLSAAYNSSVITITASITNNSGVRATFDQTLVVTAVLYEVPYTQ